MPPGDIALKTAQVGVLKNAPVHGFKARGGARGRPKLKGITYPSVFHAFLLRRRALNTNVCDPDGVFAREKRGTNRATCTRVEQLEVRGAVCCAFLPRARAGGVGGGAPVCTAQSRLVGGRGSPPWPAQGPISSVFGENMVPGKKQGKKVRRGVSMMDINY